MLNAPKSSSVSPIKKVKPTGYAVTSGAIPFVEADMEDQETKPFRLRDYVEDATEYQLLITLPTTEALDSLHVLNESMQDRILHALQQIYSYVTERTPTEGSEHYFCHVASTVYYEEHTGTDIKGKQHYKKASSLAKMLANLLDEYQKPMLKHHLTEAQFEVLTKFLKMFEAHKIATNRALQVISQEKKEHLLKHQNHSVIQKPDLLSPQKILAVTSCHPAIDRQKKTPKKTSSETRASVDAIQLVRRNLSDVFNDPSSSSDDLLIEDTMGREDHIDSNDDYLMRLTETMLQWPSSADSSIESSLSDDSEEGFWWGSSDEESLSDDVLGTKSTSMNSTLLCFEQLSLGKDKLPLPQFSEKTDNIAEKNTTSKKQQ